MPRRVRRSWVHLREQPRHPLAARVAATPQQALRTLALDLYERGRQADKPDTFPPPSTSWGVSDAPKIARCLHSGRAVPAHSPRQKARCTRGGCTRACPTPARPRLVPSRFSSRPRPSCTALPHPCRHASAARQRPCVAAAPCTTSCAPAEPATSARLSTNCLRRRCLSRCASPSCGFTTRRKRAPLGRRRTARTMMSGRARPESCRIFMMIVGATGSGKTRLLRSLAGCAASLRCRPRWPSGRSILDGLGADGAARSGAVGLRWPMADGGAADGGAARSSTRGVIALTAHAPASVHFTVLGAPFLFASRVAAAASAFGGTGSSRMARGRAVRTRPLNQ